MQLQVDLEFQGLIPSLTDDEKQSLEASLLSEGCRDALIVWQGVLVDGHNRYEICTKHGIGFKTSDKQFDNRESAKIWIIKNQFGRRNLSAFQRSELALELEGIFRERKERDRKSYKKEKTALRAINCDVIGVTDGCFVCEMGVVEVLQLHHIVPVHKAMKLGIREGNKLIVLCPTCHSIIHRVIYRENPGISDKSLISLSKNIRNKIEEIDKMVSMVLRGCIYG